MSDHIEVSIDAIHRNLIGCTDAQAWAKAFVITVREHPGIPLDEGTMIGWFANAVMSGYDEGVRTERRRDFMEKLYEVIYQAAGAATLPFMQANPEMVFPDQDVIKAIESVLEDFGIPPRVREPRQEAPEAVLTPSEPDSAS